MTVDPPPDGARRAILIDLDGVIRLWPGTHLPPLDHDAPTVERALGAVAFGPDLLWAAITGRISDAEWRATVERELDTAWPDAATPAVAAWSAMVPPVDRRVIDLVKGWRRTVPVALVTNATSRLHDDLKRMGIAGVFDAVVNSSEVGAAKPERAIFRAALDRVGASARRTLLIDDTAGHVLAAVEFGLTGYRYDGDPDRLAAFVAGWLRAG